MKGPMIHNKQGIDILGRNLAVVSVLLDAKALQENQVYEVKPNLLLINEHLNLVILPMLHLVQKEKCDSIPVALINLNEDERIFLKKGEILGCLEPSSIEMNEIVQEECDDIGEEGEKEDESIPLEKKFITSPAEVNTHRKMQLQNAEITEENREKFRLLCEWSHNLDCSFHIVYIIPSFPTRELHAHSLQNARSRFNKLNQSYSC